MRFVNMKDLTKAEIWIGHPEIIPSRNWYQHDSYFSANLAQTIFNEGDFGRLASIQDSLDGFAKTYGWEHITIGSKVKYNDLSEYYDFIISEFGKMSQSSISEAELLAAKKIRSINSINKLNNPEDFTRYIQFGYNSNGFSLEKIEASYDEMNSVSLDEVNNAA